MAYSKKDLSYNGNYKKLANSVSAAILELFEKQDRITSQYVVKQTGANINTVKKHLAALVEQDLIVKNGKTRGVWYTQKF